MIDEFKSKWDESYLRYENNSSYPKEEIVKFLSRFVRRKMGKGQYKDIVDFTKVVKGFDFGCGNGRMTALFDEFGIDAYGTDISSEAISQAKELFPDLSDKFSVILGDTIPFSDEYFDISISEGVLDSMTFELAKKSLLELERVTKKYIFISLISGDDSEHYREFNGEEIVKTKHELGTVQTYYNWSKINELIGSARFDIVFAELNSVSSLIYNYKHGRYNIVLEKKC
jgi:SAM-dependent methyltransferase